MLIFADAVSCVSAILSASLQSKNAHLYKVKEFLCYTHGMCVDFKVQFLR